MLTLEFNNGRDTKYGILAECDIAPLRVQHVGAPRATQYVVTEETRTKKCIVEPPGRCFSSNSICDEDLNSKPLVCQPAESYSVTMGARKFCKPVDAYQEDGLIFQEQSNYIL